MAMTLEESYGPIFKDHERFMKCHHDDLLLQAAAGCGQIYYLKTLYDEGIRSDYTACLRAAKYGHLECLVFLHEHSFPWNGSVLVQALWMNEMKCF